MSIWAGDGMGPDVIRLSGHTARKEHRCDACGEKINPGNRYESLFQVADGEVYTCKRCRRCCAIYDHLYDLMVSDSEELPDWELKCGHTYEERWGVRPPDSIAELAFLLPGEEPGALLGKVAP